MTVINYSALTETNLTVEFFKGDNYHYAMLRVGELGYYAGNGADGVHINPTQEFSSHISIDGVGHTLTYLLSLVNSGN